MHTLHGFTRPNHAIATLPGVDPRLLNLVLLDYCGALVGTAQHDSKVANRRRPPAVSVRSQSDEFICCCAQPIVGQHKQCDSGGYQATSALNALPKGIVIGIEIEDHYLAILIRNQSIYSAFAGFKIKLEFLTQG